MLSGWHLCMHYDEDSVGLNQETRLLRCMDDTCEYIRTRTTSA